ncbi:MAG: M10 family metallopeptidase C-terminal domain-containing protein, partial [Methylophilaceae bacterium]|nr:M10 family metallopeptidase C-terminal domain-containing protein [Methylophilaceae bacterium]
MYRSTYILSQSTAGTQAEPTVWGLGGNVFGFGTDSVPREGVLVSGNWYVNKGPLPPWSSAFKNLVAVRSLPQLSASGVATQFTLALGNGNNVSTGDRVEITDSAVVGTKQSIALPTDMRRPTLGKVAIKAMERYDSNGDEVVDSWRETSQTLAIGQLIRVEVSVSEVVNIVYSNFNTTISEVSLQIGKITRQAKLNLEASQNTNRLLFDYIIANGDVDSSGGVQVGSIARNWCTYTDASGNRMEFPELLLSSSNNISVNATVSTRFSEQPLTTRAVTANVSGVTPIKWLTSDPSTSITTVKYCFYSTAPDTLSDSDAATFQPWSDTQRLVLKQIIANVESFSQLRFVEVTDPADAQIALGAYNHGNTVGGKANYPGTFSEVWINTNVRNWNSPSTYLNGMGNSARLIIVHEFGHALGLKHPGNYNAGGGVTGSPYLNVEQDNQRFTVESYNPAPGTIYYSPSNYMIYDVAALQFLYGTNKTYNSGDNTYQVELSTSSIVVESFENNSLGVATLIKNKLGSTCIWDSGGNDTLSLIEPDSRSATLNLNQGSFSFLKGGVTEISIAYGADIENAIASLGDDILISNTLNNRLSGG